MINWSTTSQIIQEAESVMQQAPELAEMRQRPAFAPLPHGHYPDFHGAPTSSVHLQVESTCCCSLLPSTQSLQHQLSVPEALDSAATTAGLPLPHCGSVDTDIGSLRACIFQYSRISRMRLEKPPAWYSKGCLSMQKVLIAHELADVYGKVISTVHAKAR